MGYLPDAGSGSLAELTASLAAALDQASRALVEASAVVTLNAVPDQEDPSVIWEDRIRRRENEQNELSQELDGFYRLAARAEAAGDPEKRDDHLRRADQSEKRIEVLAQEVEGLQRQIEGHDHRASEHEADADINLAAFLVANLEKASARNGLVAERIGNLCDQTFADWRFVPSDGDLHWTCAAKLPLTSGGARLTPCRGPR